MLEEIAMKIKRGGAPADQKVIKDDAFLEDLVKETDLLQSKEQERNRIAREAAEIEAQVLRDRIKSDERAHQIRIKECDIKYQHNQHQALKNELDRATNYYESVL